MAVRLPRLDGLTRAAVLAALVAPYAYMYATGAAPAAARPSPPYPGSSDMPTLITTVLFTNAFVLGWPALVFAALADTVPGPSLSHTAHTEPATASATALVLAYGTALTMAPLFRPLMHASFWAAWPLLVAGLHWAFPPRGHRGWAAAGAILFAALALVLQPHAGIVRFQLLAASAHLLVAVRAAFHHVFALAPVADTAEPADKLDTLPIVVPTSTPKHTPTPLANIRAGRGRFVACWLALVEKHTSSPSTPPAEQREELHAAADEITHITGFRAIAGLWHEHLAESLLWTVAQPGQRHVDAPHDTNDTEQTTAPPAPTWSWMSVDAPITSTLPTTDNHSDDSDSEDSDSEDSDSEDSDAPSVQLLATHCSVLGRAVLALAAPMLPVCRVLATPSGGWSVLVRGHLWGTHAVHFVPDLASFELTLSDDDAAGALVCVALQTVRHSTDTVHGIPAYALHGLVVRRVPSTSPVATFLRVGVFQTDSACAGSLAQLRLAYAPRETIHVV